MAQNEKVPTKEDGLGLCDRRAFYDCGMRHPVLHSLIGPCGKYPSETTC